MTDPDAQRAHSDDIGGPPDTGAAANISAPQPRSQAASRPPSSNAPRSSDAPVSSEAEEPGAGPLAQPLLGESLQEHVAELADLDQRPVAEHIERYEAVHHELQAALHGIHDPGG